MESKNRLNGHERENMLQAWLQQLGYAVQPVPMKGDASSRCYYRISTPNRTLVLMDASPDEHDVAQFVHISRALAQAGLLVPDVVAADLGRGFLLLGDLGEQPYLNYLNPDNAKQCYDLALDALVTMQTSADLNHLDLDCFGKEWMHQEWQWHKEWFLQKLLHVDYAEVEADLDASMQQLIDSALEQPQAFMHRDYHSANLMYVNGEVGILDFQDAFIGPVTYDLASLLRDCYIDWPDDFVEQCLVYYLQQHKVHSSLLAEVELPLLRRYFDWMGMQRHLKALMTFARKYVRDQQAGYLRHIPRTLNYVLKISQRYPELQALNQFYTDKVLVQFKQMEGKF